MPVHRDVCTDVPTSRRMFTADHLPRRQRLIRTIALTTAPHLSGR
jgi:hypothetical protein